MNKVKNKFANIQKIKLSIKCKLITLFENELKMTANIRTVLQMMFNLNLCEHLAFFKAQSVVYQNIQL